MSSDAQLACRCGAVTGTLRNASPKTVTRIVCYCDDCQAFLHHLKRADLLDEHGGTDIVQVAPSALSFERGREHINGVRLSPRGMHRWYASCCNTPLGNTMTPAIPFVGIIAQGFIGQQGTGSPAASQAPRSGHDELFGQPLGGVMGKFAVGQAPEGSLKPNLRLLARAFGTVLGWRFTGKTWPHPFFDRETRAPSYPVSTLSPTERERLRPLCGPRPSLAGKPEHVQTQQS